MEILKKINVVENERKYFLFQKWSAVLWLQAVMFYAISTIGLYFVGIFDVKNSVAGILFLFESLLLGCLPFLIFAFILLKKFFCNREQSCFSLDKWAFIFSFSFILYLCSEWLSLKGIFAGFLFVISLIAFGFWIARIITRISNLKERRAFSFLLLGLFLFGCLLGIALVLFLFRFSLFC